MKHKDKQKFEEWREKQKGHDDPMADAYGLAIFSYAEAWADLMEAELEKAPDVNFGEMAKRTSREADTDGITGFMYGSAVGVLSECWEHGGALRTWHNDQYGVKEEDADGGVVNPAILTLPVGKKPESGKTAERTRKVDEA